MLLNPIERVSPKTLMTTTEHRPFALPQNQTWVMAQAWQNLLFMHYRVPIDALRPMIPSQLEIDTYDGDAWISVVPFLMNHVHLRGVPPFPTTGKFPELNLRTYVKIGDKAGVWFFSLEAASLLAVITARLTFNLPYFYATMSLAEENDAFHYKSVRKHPNAAPADFDIRYRPTGAVQDYPVGSLDRWLSDRYVLYSANRRGEIFIGHINHLPWELQPAEATININQIANASGIPVLDETPLCHFVRHIDVLAWAIEPI